MLIPLKVPETKTKIITKRFGPVIGVDFRNEETAPFRVPESVNYYRGKSGDWETHPGYRKFGTFPVQAGEDDPICYGIEKFEYVSSGSTVTKVVIHVGNRLYTWDNYPIAFTDETNLTSIYSDMPAQIMKFIQFNNMLIMLGGGEFLYYDGTTVGEMKDIAFIPTMWIGKSPDAGDGTVYQQRNIIQPKFKETFVGDDTSDEYQLSLTTLDAAAVTATVNDVAKTEDTHFTVNRTTGLITWTVGNIPPAPSTTGAANVEFTPSKTTSGYLEMITGCTEMLVFDNRLFVTGNPLYPNRILWTGFNDSSYFGEVMYNDRAGAGASPIVSMQMLGTGDSFLALKQDTQQDASYSIVSIEEFDDELNPKTYKAVQGIGTIGALSYKNSCVFVDDNIFLSNNGVNAISRELNISSERNIEHRSTLIDNKLLLETLSNAIFEQHGNYLYIYCPDTGNAYLADSNIKAYGDTAVSQYVEYEWACLKNLGTWTGQYPEYIDDNGDVTNPPDTSGTETGTRDGATATGAYIGGVFTPAYNLKSFGEDEFYLCCDSCIYMFNLDLTRTGTVSELTSSAYAYDNRFIEDYFCLSFDWYGYTNYFKTIVQGRNDMLLTTREQAEVDVTWRTEQTDLANSKVITLKSTSYWNYGLYNYGNFAYGGRVNVSYILKKLKTKEFRRLQIKIASARAFRCTAFQSLTLEVEVSESNLK